MTDVLLPVAVETETRRRDLRQAIFAALVGMVGLSTSEGEPYSPEEWLKRIDVSDGLAELALARWSERDTHRLAAPPGTGDDGRPDECKGIEVDRCALHPDGEESRVSLGNFVDPHAWRCRGCRREGSRNALT